MADPPTSMQYGREAVKFRDSGGNGGKLKRYQGKSRESKTWYTCTTARAFVQFFVLKSDGDFWA